ncbi:unnamed protein product, partial [Ectocarpus fasciculatus]
MAPTVWRPGAATAFIDLDFVYGRSEEDAAALRSSDGNGFMAVTEKGLPYLNDDGTWLIADQRTARFPVTFALHVVLLLEHNRCCVEIAPGEGAETDEDICQACRGWTIAVFQHITENDFLIRLLGGSVSDFVETSSSTSSASASSASASSASASSSSAATASGLSSDGGGDTGSSGRRTRRKLREQIEQDALENPRERHRRGLWSTSDYDEETNPGADTFTLTAGAVAFESALPPTVRVVAEGYESTRYDYTELAAAVGADSLSSFFDSVEVADVLRGAVLSPVLAADSHFTTAVSNGSPLFKLPVDAVQRGRDHGLPTYNDARQAFGLDVATSFSDVTTSSTSSSTTSSSSASDSDELVATVLSAAYGGEISTLDAVTGALAEPKLTSSGGFFGELLHAAWLEQLYRTREGDRFHHLHSRSIEDASLATISDLLNRTTGAADLPLSAFAAAGVEVCGADCTAVGEEDVKLSDSYKMAWELQEDEEFISLSLSAKSIGDRGMVGVGFGGLTMSDAQDFVICELISTDEAECIDRQPTGGRSLPPRDDEDAVLEVLSVEVEGEWTTVTFLKPTSALDDQDYDLAQDIEDEGDTEVIYSFGESLGQHPTSSRGASTINFATGDVDIECDEDNFVSLHGALMLIAWMVLAPWGIYYVRYRKGEEIDFIWRYEWWEMHEEIMIVASEAVLPLGITAIFASGSQRGTEHAHWGYYMIVAVIAQVLSGWLRVKGLGGKNANFSVFHRFNKFFHIYAGRFAYLAGVIQCYRGLELVASNDKLIFSAGDGLDLQLGSFGFVYEKAFPAWFGLIALIFLFLETRKQYRRFFKKGSAKVLGCVEIINERYKGEGGADDNGAPQYQRLVPRTEDLPMYSLAEFNEKVLNGQSWVLVDGAILDVSEFALRHPGGRRLILNALGTDVTAELLGEDMSVGHAMSFSPHVHSERAWTILKGLVIGYIDEDDDEDEEDDGGNVDGGKPPSATQKTGEKRRFTIAGKSAVFLGTRGSVRSALTGDTLVNTDERQQTGQVPKSLQMMTQRSRLAISPLSPKSPSWLITAEALSAKAKRLNGLATISTRLADVAGAPVGVSPEEMGVPLRRVLPKRSNSDSGRLLERFHVCPLLFREKMGAASTFGRGYLPTSRPVYRYIFLCPGQAQNLVQSITGVCYFNMRAQEK